MKQKTKKLIASVLALAMLMTCMAVPTGAFGAEAATATVTVQANPVAKDAPMVYEDLVVASDAYTGEGELADTAGAVTLADVFAVVHEKMGKADGFALSYTDWGLSVATLFGDTSGDFSYYINGAGSWSPNDTVKNGDFVAVYILGDGTGYSDKYLNFDKQKYIINEGEALAMTLSYQTMMTTAPAAETDRTVVLTDTAKKTYEAVTDANGKAVFANLPAGTYTASVKLKETPDFIVMPWAKVTVNAVEKAVAPSKVKSLKVKTAKTTSLKLTWEKQEGVAGYQVYQYSAKSKKYKKIATLKGDDKNVTTVKKLSAGKGYKFKVRAYTDSETGSFSAVLKAPTKPTKTAITKLTTGSKKHYVKATWKKKTATGYQVKIATNSKFTKNHKTYKVKSYKTVSKKMDNLKKGRTYYVKVRAYKTYGDSTAYGSWSKVKKIECK